jgi:hypothetical protein
MLLQPKRYILAVLLSAFIFLACQFSALIAVDPLRLFHKPWIRDDYYISELRFQAAGIIRNTEFDSIILGTSNAANFSRKEASEIWDTTFVNISPDGSWLSERAIILNFALDQKKLKNVIISMDAFHENRPHPVFSPANYNFLYNENRWDDLKVYSNLKYAKYLACRNLIISSDALCRSTRNLETVTKWASIEAHRKRFGGLNKWFESKNNGQIQHAFMEIVENTRAIKNGIVASLNSSSDSKKATAERSAFDNYVLHYIKENPDTRFYLFFPPSSRMLRALTKKAKPDEYNKSIEILRHVISAIGKYPNAQAFGFDHLEFTNDIANYKDPIHYHPRYNSAILRWMKNNDHELTSENIEAYIKTTSELAENYDVVSFGEKIESFLQGTYSGSE